MPAPEPNDFFPDDLVKEHGRNIEELRASVTKLVARFGDDDCFGSTFEQMASKDKRIDKVIKASLKDLLQSDSETKSILKDHVAEIDRGLVRLLGTRVGFAIWSVALIVVTAIVTRVIGR